MNVFLFAIGIVAGILRLVVIGLAVWLAFVGVALSVMSAIDVAHYIYQVVCP